MSATGRWLDSSEGMAMFPAPCKNLQGVPRQSAVSHKEQKADVKQCFMLFMNYHSPLQIAPKCAKYQICGIL